MELLAKLLGGYDRVKILRFFLHHENAVIDTASLVEKVKGKSLLVKKELQALASIGFLEKKKSRNIFGDRKTSKEVVVWKLGNEFPHTEALKDLLFDFEEIDKKELSRRFSHTGRIKLFLVSGVFVGETKSRVDILIVGEALKKPLVDKCVDVLSSELGREVSCSLMDVEEYEYRKKMYDKFIRDIYDVNHEVVIDKLGKKEGTQI